MRRTLFITILLVVFCIVFPFEALATSNVDNDLKDETGTVTDNTGTEQSLKSDPSTDSLTDKKRIKTNDTVNNTEQDKTADPTNDEEQNVPSSVIEQRDAADTPTDSEQKETVQEEQSTNKAEQKTEKSSTTVKPLTVATVYTKSTVSKIGRILNSDAKVYETIDGKNFKAGTKYTDRSFYIRKQAKGNGQIYYLISTRRSSTIGVIGWVNAEEMRVQGHRTIDSKAKTLYLDGTGWAYSTPWGASKDVLIDNLSPYKYNVFEVNLTEKVGDYLWYRGTLNGKTVWIQGNNAEGAKESTLSKVGRIQSESADFYKTFGNAFSKVNAGNKYTRKLYYINKQLEIFGEVFYQLLDSPGSDIAGWVNANDVRSQQYTVISQQSKTLYLDGTGWAYSEPWGGAKDVVNKNLAPYKYLAFDVTKEVKVGDYLWYLGTLDGKKVWIQGNNFLDKPGYNESDLNRIGRISKPDTIIYSDLNAGSSMKKAGFNYTDTVVYIKKQAKISSRLYYLISNKRSSSDGVIGWVNASDIRTQSHRIVDERNKTLYLDGTGWAYTDPWGGSKDIVQTNLKPYKHLKFNVTRTEKVGKFVWFLGDLNGQAVWIMGSNFMNVNINQSSTSKVGRIQDAGTYIYDDIMQGTSLSKAGLKRTDKVYYIKKKAAFNNQLFYLISNQRSSTKGIVGWVKSEEIRVQEHSVANIKNFNYYLDGTGWSYSDPWGGSKDIVSRSLPKGELFKVTLTEKVGNYFWYKGTLKGKTVWVQAFNVIAPEFSSISRVGRISASTATIYKTIGDVSNSFKANSKYTGKLFYIKRQAKIFDQIYYRITINRNSGVVGWINSDELRTQTHVQVDTKRKSFFLDGTGWAYSDPWGGRKDVIYEDLSKYFKNKALFEVNLTEKIGDYTWYRGTLDGKTVWIMSFNVLASVTEKTKYDLTLERMKDIQMKVSPLTDQAYAWVSGTYIKKGRVTADVLNVRSGPSTNYKIVGQLLNGTSVNVVDKMDGWYAIKHSDNEQWVYSTPEDVRYYLNPLNFTDSFRGKLQFLNLSQSANINAREVNTKILRGKGILEGQAQTFISAGREHGLNEIYLISHALLETGNGTSKLATGVKVNGRTVYNMYGIGARDECPLSCGAQYAYDAGWFTPEKAIIGGAAFVSNNYVGEGQNTLYKMRWNPLFADTYGYASHQYASDIGWAYKQTYGMYNLYNLLSSYNLVFDIPVYR
ncbi:GW dipeptide domain-containing protein [Virgibacillus siamensis]|uniref:GW dipeptide domain-containing protein n=1 Tax=Virgibacillus siamensis TaxID=480071 RepID=UPI0009862B2E|nr:GW dipeptide domain-containing protein [Virgibacillus siamensis]